jgi:cytochrome oxidase Cu insertion factor (SCO1/SenC/PrrC family)
VTRRQFATALPLLLLPWLLGALPPPAAAQVTGKTELDKLLSAARLSPLVGQDPPPFTLVRPDGRRVGLSDFTGHVVLLYFWTTTSPYATLEMPASIDKLQRDLKDRRFTVVAVNIKDTKEEVGPWIQSRDATTSWWGASRVPVAGTSVRPVSSSTTS